MKGVPFMTLEFCLAQLPVYVGSPTKCGLSHSNRGQCVPAEFCAWFMEPPGREGFTVGQEGTKMTLDPSEGPTL